MPNAYKLQLLLNLKQHYDEPLWRTLTYFQNGRDELLFVVPADQDTKKLSEDLFKVLDKLPDIHLPPERTLISFCHADGNGYYSKLINPIKQDKINLALIGYLPERKITIEELRSVGIKA
ncbi:MAG: hypothetical protein V4687_00800 [Bacteroidota bacterium]